MRRAGTFALIVVTIVFTLNAISWLLFQQGHEGDGPPPFFFLFVIVAITVAVLASRWAARRVAAPAGAVLDAVERLAEGHYSTRVDPAGARDMRELARSFNGLAERLETLEEQRRNLVADVAHELRTPLSVVRGNLEGIADGLYEPEAGRMQLLLDEVAVISRLIDDFQTLSLVEAGGLALHPEPGDLAALVESVVSAFEERATAQGIVLSANSASGPEFAFDSVRLREVLENLVANALRHTPAGGRVEVRLTWPFGEARVEVSDTGRGIPESELPFVFERYRKAPDSTGQGLGLPIARRLVEAHGGTIEVSSVVGVGTVFLVRLPV